MREYERDVFECGGLWKRLLREERGGLFSFYTATGGRGNELMGRIVTQSPRFIDPSAAAIVTVE